jgi:hypothetical protein
MFPLVIYFLARYRLLPLITAFLARYRLLPFIRLPPLAIYYFSSEAVLSRTQSALEAQRTIRVAA